jgi:2-polyprenyl-3-methyl-5-hydroxy-6-metoxy-1,4-benzoquinol methylase
VTENSEYAKNLKDLLHFIDYRYNQAVEAEHVRTAFRTTASALRRMKGIEDIILSVQTKKPIAYDSPDHTTPWGTKQDNHTDWKFCQKLAEWIPIERLSVLDIGCSGGGFVKSLWDMGGLAVGIEGSDYSKLRGRAEWGTIPHLLFTADATVPFQVMRRTPSGDVPVRFSVITGWEFIEHIHRDGLPGVFENIDRHLEPGGVVILSVCPDDDIIDGVNLHQTVEQADWWFAEAAKYGFAYRPEVVSYFGSDWVRKEGNSFYLVLSRHYEAMLFREKFAPPPAAAIVNGASA